LAAEALLSFVSYQPSEDENGIDPRREQAIVGALLLNEGIAHLRAISKAEIRAVFVNTAGL
jgi:hypothetical protein